MDLRNIDDEDVVFYASYILQDSYFNPSHFPLFFKDFVELPDGTYDKPGKDHYEIRDESGLVVWQWKNDKPLIKFK